MLQCCIKSCSECWWHVHGWHRAQLIGRGIKSGKYFACFGVAGYYLCDPRMTRRIEHTTVEIGEGRQIWAGRSLAMLGELILVRHNHSLSIASVLLLCFVASCDCGRLTAIAAHSGPRQSIESRSML